MDTEPECAEWQPPSPHDKTVIELSGPLMAAFHEVRPPQPRAHVAAPGGNGDLGLKLSAIGCAMKSVVDALGSQGAGSVRGRIRSALGRSGLETDERLEHLMYVGNEYSPDNVRDPLDGSVED